MDTQPIQTPEYAQNLVLINAYLAVKEMNLKEKQALNTQMNNDKDYKPSATILTQLGPLKKDLKRLQDIAIANWLVSNNSNKIN